MDAKTIVTRFFSNTTLEDRRKLNRYGIFRHNVPDVIRRLEYSPVRMNFPKEVIQLLKTKIMG